MTVTKNDLVDAIAKLNDMTRRKALVWQTVDRMQDGEAALMTSYTTEFEGRTLRVTEFDRTQQRSAWARAVYNHPSSLPTPRYTLEIVDGRGQALYTFPDVQGIADLFASARTQAVDVEGLINELLKPR